MILKPVLLVPALLAACLAAGAASAATLSVAGTSDPFLAGQPSGAACCNGDSAPAESPVYAGAVAGGTTYTFTNVTGGVSYDGGTPSTDPDGASSYLISTPDYEGGATSINNIAGFYNTPINALVGVFLSASDPNANPAPAGLDFGPSALTTGFATLSPELQQIFFIGDGLTGDGTGAVQTFIAPLGATRLYLATTDGYGWYNDTGAIEVTVNAVGAVPEPAPSALILCGLAALGWVARRRR